MAAKLTKPILPPNQKYLLVTAPLGNSIQITNTVARTGINDITFNNFNAYQSFLISVLLPEKSYGCTVVCVRQG